MIAETRRIQQFWGCQGNNSAELMHCMHGRNLVGDTGDVLKIIFVKQATLILGQICLLLVR